MPDPFKRPQWMKDMGVPKGTGFLSKIAGREKASAQQTNQSVPTQADVETRASASPETAPRQVVNLPSRQDLHSAGEEGDAIMADKDEQHKPTSPSSSAPESYIPAPTDRRTDAPFESTSQKSTPKLTNPQDKERITTSLSGFLASPDISTPTDRKTQEPFESTSHERTPNLTSPQDKMDVEFDERHEPTAITQHSASGSDISATTPRLTKKRKDITTVDASTQWSVEGEAAKATAASGSTEKGGPDNDLALLGSRKKQKRTLLPQSFKSDTIVYAGRAMHAMEFGEAKYLVQEVQSLLQSGLDPNSKRVDETLADIAFKCLGRQLPDAQRMASADLVNAGKPETHLNNKLLEVVNLIIGHPSFDLEQVKSSTLRALLPSLIPQAQFIRAAKAADEPRMMELLDAGLDQNIVLPRAVKEGARDAVMLLLERGATSVTFPPHVLASLKQQHTQKLLQNLLTQPLFREGSLDDKSDESFEAKLPNLVEEAGTAAPNPLQGLDMNMALVLRHHHLSVSDVDLAEQQLPRLVQNVDTLVSHHRAALTQSRLRLASQLLDNYLPADIKTNPDVAESLTRLRQAANLQQTRQITSGSSAGA